LEGSSVKVETTQDNSLYFEYIQVIQEGEESLKEAAKGLGLYMGGTINLHRAQGDQEYLRIFKEQFDLLTAENECKQAYILNKWKWDQPNYEGCLEETNFAI